MNRIKKAAELNRFCSGDYIVKHSTSAVDTAACIYQMKEFWKQLSWPDLVGSYNLLYKLVDVSSPFNVFSHGPLSNSVVSTLNYPYIYARSPGPGPSSVTQSAGTRNY